MSASPYQTTMQHTFRQAIAHLLTRLVGSSRVIQMMADDIVELQAEYFDADRVPPGHIVWRGTSTPDAIERAEDEPTVTAVLPLITNDDITEMVQGLRKSTSRTWARERGIRRMVRLVHAGMDNGGPQLLCPS